MICLKTTLFALLTAITLSACGGDKTNAQSDNTTPANDDVKTRQALMKDWRGANDIIGGMVENPANFDKAVLLEQAEFLSSSSANMWTYFGDANAKGKAQETVWSDSAGFKAKADEFDKAVAELIIVANSAQSADDIKAAAGAVGESCGGCHKGYKIK